METNRTQLIKNVVTGKERALYGVSDAVVEACAFRGEEDGESCLKETHDLTVKNCSFDLRYPLWHCRSSLICDCKMIETCRAPMWYDEDLNVERVTCTGVKALRECRKITLTDCDFTSAEFGWKCGDINSYKLKVVSEYAFFGSKDMYHESLELKGKYSFQYVENVIIINSVLDTKDAFWHSKNVTVRNCVIKGEYLGWYSENLTLINCKIKGTQPLCYAKNLKMTDCEMTGCDLSFEHSTVDVTVLNRIDSVKNPIGRIVCLSCGEVITDEFLRGTFSLTETEE